MRNGIVFVGTALLALGGCAMLDRTSSSENVKSAYAGTASMTAQQVEELLQNQGFSDVTNLHQNGDNWIGAAVTSAGKHVNFDLDKDGMVHTK